MLDQLKQSIALSQEILSLCRAFSSPPNVTPVPAQASSLLASIAAAGIPKLEHPRVSSTLGTALHEATQTHFRRMCLSFQQTHAHLSVQSLQDLALQAKATFTKLYTDKLAAAASRIIAVQAAQKRPYATDVLIYAFDQSQTPTKRERQVLASLTGMTLEQVRVWFQNRRQRTKKRPAELQPRRGLELDELLTRVAVMSKPVERDEYFDDDDSGYSSGADRDRSASPIWRRSHSSLTTPSTTSRSWPASYTRQDLSTEFHAESPLSLRTASQPPAHAQTTTMSELTRLMSRLTLRHRRDAPCNGAVSAANTSTSAVKGRKSVASAIKPAAPNKKAARKDPETGRKVAGRRYAPTAAASLPSSSSSSPPVSSTIPAPSTSAPVIDTSSKPRKRAGPLRRKPAGKALARQASESSVASTSSSDSSRATSYSSDFSLASDSSFTSVESVPIAPSMECFQSQQQTQFDPLAAFDFTQLFSSQPSDILPQPVADFELPPDLLAGLQIPMDTAALPPPESTDFLALLNDPTIQDLLQSVQDMDVVAPQQTQESLTFNNTFDVGSVDTSAFLDLSASTLPTFDAMFGLDTSSFQDTLWNSPGFSLPITA